MRITLPSDGRPAAVQRLRSPWRRPLRHLLVPGMAAALVVAGCSGDDGDTSSDTTAATTTAGGATVTGTVTAPDGLPSLPDGAELTVTLDDFPADGSTSVTLDSVVTAVSDGDFPVAFELTAAEVDEAAGYGVTALVQSGDELLLIGDTVMVLTNDAPSTGVEIPVRSLDAGGGDGGGDEGAAVTLPGVEPNREPATAEQAAEWQARLDTALASADGLPGIWVAIAHPELGYWSGAAGEAVVGERAAALGDHSRIGSTTKTFTAVAVLEQVAAGTLSLDDTVATVVPDLASQFPETADITVEQLLNMTSGLPDYANVPGAVIAGAVEDPERVWTPEDLIASALAASPVDPPGTAGYSTTNYTILGEMLEAVTDLPVEQVLTDVAERAGLEGTALLPGDQNSLPDPSSHGYIEPAGVKELADVGATAEAGTDVTDWSLSWGGAGGGMHSTVEDLFEWAATGVGTTLLDDDLAQQRLTFATDLGANGTYGLGIQQLVPGWIGHVGQVIGWESIVLYEPATGATFAALINGTGSLATAVLPLWAETFGVAL